MGRLAPFPSYLPRPILAVKENKGNDISEVMTSLLVAVLLEALGISPISVGFLPERPRTEVNVFHGFSPPQHFLGLSDTGLTITAEVDPGEIVTRNRDKMMVRHFQHLLGQL